MKMAEDQEKRAKGLTKAYGLATSRLRDENRERFNELYQAAAAEQGIEWSPKLSEEQRAEQEIAALVERFPHLADRFREQVPEEPPVS
jgi:hypothetical protein